MTSRQGLWMALVGFVIIALCGLVFVVGSATVQPSDLTIVFLVVVGFVGQIVLIVGLTLAAVAALVKGSGK